MVSKTDLMQHARITRAQMRYWERLWPVLQRKRGQFLPAEAVALGALSQIVRDTSCKVMHLKPVAATVFGALTDGDWQRFEHRRLLVTFPGGKVEFVPSADPQTTWPLGTLVSLDLGPHVQAVRARALGLPTIARSPQMPLLEQRKRRGKDGGNGGRGWGGTHS